MLARHGAGFAPAVAENEARRSNAQAGERGKRPNKPPQFETQAIRAELTGSDRCEALGITAVGHTPILSLCRRLIKAGFNSDRPLIAYRGEIACILVGSIGKAENLDINSKGTGFVRSRLAVRTAPPVRPDVPEHHLPCGLPLGKAAPIIGSDGGVP